MLQNSTKFTNINFQYIVSFCTVATNLLTFIFSTFAV